MLFGNGKKGTITRVGNIDKSEWRALEDVYHVEALKHNLLSIS